MNKFQQLQRLIEFGVAARDHGTSGMFGFGILVRTWNNWPKVQSVIETCETPVDRMAQDFLLFEYDGAPKPEWLQHMGDLG